MGFGVLLLFRYHKTVSTDLRWHFSPRTLTYSEKHYHAEHWQQGRDHHTDENGQFLGSLLLGRPLRGAPWVLLQGLAGWYGPRLRLIDAGGQAVVEKGSPLRHVETCL